MYWCIVGTRARDDEDKNKTTLFFSPLVRTRGFRKVVVQDLRGSKYCMCSWECQLESSMHISWSYKAQFIAFSLKFPVYSFISALKDRNDGGEVLTRPIPASHSWWSYTKTAWKKQKKETGLVWYAFNLNRIHIHLMYKVFI